ncbi:hypothetical protein [Mucilaginibacter aquariorum]|uniref:CD-NTase associated protein 4-like DNA endonuclease domain-containing protein n=1 Tax=Mucilaginibacter aquariorum TaxID=2967225 RepID=A0ABT1SZG7_9SPHI|nr:hypothetical protein [Mucilaginibacter aquariorum]MCQ6957613.1 hypothetical protein [Mucilaginibacter aquariorum]
MPASKTQQATSAADTSIGFDYQFYHFFLLLLDLRHGEEIGIEQKDDVHVDLADGSQLLIQTKHTVQQNAAGESINLTERDKDLWKTLSNWSKVIAEQSDAKAFLLKTTFQLATNKQAIKNPFILKLIQLQNGDIKTKDFKDYLKELAKGTTDEGIKTYIEAFKALPADQLAGFAKKISFELNHDDLISQIKKRLLEKIHIRERVEDVYRNLHSELRDTNYLNVKAGVRNVISFEGFNKKFGKCFKVAISTKLPIRDLPYILPDNPEHQLFVRQLIDIGDISAASKDAIIAYTTQMLQLLNNLKDWEDNGDFLDSDRRKFNRETAFIQQTAFKTSYRRIRAKLEGGTGPDELDDDIKDSALSLLDDMRRQILQFDETQLSLELSHGHFYLLTEEKEIGWHLDWQKRY